jgi:hypothetical protein
MAAQRASEKHAISLLTPPPHGREIEAERVRAAAATQQAPQQEPREALRLAHSQRAEAEKVSARLRQALDRAREHLAEAVEARDAAQRDLDTVEAADTARLIAELANGAGRVEAGGGGERLALAAAEHQLGIANRAVETLGTDLAAAEKRLAGA